MKKAILVTLFFSIGFLIKAQTIGIKTSAVRFPLGFSTALGQKISFYDDGNAGNNNYGIGIQSGLLQIHSDSINHDIAMGYGSSANFTETFRFKGNGNLGIGITNPEKAIDIKGKIRVRNPGNTANTAGFWMNNSSNSTTPAFIGLQNDTTVGFYGQVSGWSLVMNTTTGYLGIKNSTPKAPLSFPATLGKKISVFSGTNGNNGFAVSGNRLQIFSENPSAGVAIGNIYMYNPGFGDPLEPRFNNSFEVKTNGALALKKNTGLAGQYLISSGSSTAPTWRYVDKYKPEISYQTGDQITLIPPAAIEIPGLAKTINVQIGDFFYVKFDFEIEAESIACGACGPSEVEISLDDGGYTEKVFEYYIANGQKTHLKGSYMLPVIGSGNHFFKVVAGISTGPSVKIGSASSSFSKTYLITERVD
ncbi:hypothetical protein ACQ33O_05855 [Ferruginibacter sp. SUN002]|uniref:hypothetical protein n=1 Tax=Ferruginibacter sp. SUN002 TaxID=2937789 RepID=UPI003D3695B1